MSDAWQERLNTPNQSTSYTPSYVGALGVSMLKIRHNEGTVLIGYSFIRRVELTAEALWIYASECIVQIVGNGLEALLEPIQHHRLDALSIGEKGITHITLKPNL
jgi:hypothetical protein